MLDYKKEIPAMTDLLALYSSVGWTNYTNNPTMLEQAVKASLWQLAVYDEKELVAYIRLVGDGHSVIFVQDLLVRPDHQRQGIGKKLLKEAFINHSKTYQGPKAHIPIKVMLNLFRNRIFDHTDQNFHDTVLVNRPKNKS